MTGKLYYWVANWNLSRSQAALLLHGPVEDMVDMIHANVAAAREKYYKQGVRRFGGYVTGSPDIRWSTQDWNSFPRDVTLWSIDQSNLDLPLISNAKKVVDDQEPGAKTVGQTVAVAEQRLTKGDDLIVYVDQAGLPAVEHAMNAKGLPHGQIIAYQYAGGNQTGGIADLSVVLVTHMPPPVPPKPRPSDARRAQIIVTDDVDEGWNVEVKPLPMGPDPK